MKHILNDPIFFYAVAYVLFLVVAWRFARKPALEWVDGEIGKIRDEVEQAKRLRAEAEAMLAECKAKRTATIAEAEAIIAHAKEELVRLREEAENNLKYVLKKHEKHARDRIRYMEEDAVKAVRAAAVDKALAMVRKALVERMDEAGIARLADQAIAEMPKLAATKAKAA